MLEGIQFFFSSMVSVSFVLECLMVGFVTTVIFLPFRAKWREVLIMALSVLGVAAVYFLAVMLMIGANVAIFGIVAREGVLMRIIGYFSIILLIELGYMLLFCRYSPSVRLILFFTAWAVVNISYALAPLLSYCFNDVNDYGLIHDLAYVLGILFALRVSRYSISKFDVIPRRGTALIVALNAIVSALVIWYQLYEYIYFVSGTYYVLSVFICSYAILFVAYMLVYWLSEGNREITEMSVSQTMISANLEMSRLTEENLKELRIARHELKNRCAYFRLMLDNGEYEKLGEELTSMAEGAVTASSRMADTGNRTVDAILNTEIAKAKPYGITVETSLTVPHELPYSDGDLCGILINIIGNAVEYYRRAGMKGTVHVVMRPEQGYLYILVSNELRDGEDAELLLRLQTSKQDKKLHGYGTKVVRQTAEKNGGFVNYDVENETFYAEVMLPLAEEKGKG